MFTGLVKDVGTIQRVDCHSGNDGDATVLGIRPGAIDAGELELGESVAVDGVCLTVTEARDGAFTVLAGAETLRRTTLAGLAVGDRVNLERALALGDRLGGHMVSGHVDAVGRVVRNRDRGSNIDIAIETTGDILRYVIEKGSIAIDGISLTVNSVDSQQLSVALIPHTVANTTLADKAPGATVNIEVDMVGKYVEKLLGGYR